MKIALAHELRNRGRAAVTQQPVAVWYDNVRAGDYFTDLVSDDFVIAELMSAEYVVDAQGAQLLNYLRATGKE